MLEESNSKVKTALVQLYFNNYSYYLELLYITRKTYIKMKKKKRESLFICLFDCLITVGEMFHVTY